MAELLEKVNENLEPEKIFIVPYRDRIQHLELFLNQLCMFKQLVLQDYRMDFDDFWCKMKVRLCLLCFCAPLSCVFTRSEQKLWVKLKIRNFRCIFPDVPYLNVSQNPIKIPEKQHIHAIDSRASGKSY